MQQLYTFLSAVFLSLYFNCLLSLNISSCYQILAFLTDFAS